MKISRDIGSPCIYITISATGPAAMTWHECLGIYCPTEEYSAGRKIFKHINCDIVLMVPSGYVNWVIENNVNIEPERGYMASACALVHIQV